jgi:hypothetical protein
MLERILTITTAIWFLASGVVGILTGTVDIISMVITGKELLGLMDFFLISTILTPLVGLILIYLGKGLDIVFNLQEK